jgi:hypothetical protein
MSTVNCQRASTTAPQLVEFAKLYVDLAQLNCPETKAKERNLPKPELSFSFLVI